MMIAEHTKQLMRERGLYFNKSLGQNFLTDEGVLADIVEGAAVDGDTFVLEIGPGIGVLTCELAARARQVTAVETDARLIPVLQENLQEFNNVALINQDILKVDLAALLKPYQSWGKRKVVANLPYYITTPVIMKLLEGSLPLDEIVVMVQREVAERLCAAPDSKAYGAITLSVEYYSEAEVLFDVPPHCFVPQPKVWSSVIRLRIRKQPPVELADEAHFFRLIKAAFGQRRKTFVNAAANFGGLSTCKEDIKKVLNKFGISENVRGESLSLVQFAQISNEIQGQICAQ